MAATSSFFRTDGDGMTLVLKVTPRASRDAIEGVVETADGWALKVAVTAPPDKGKANAQVVALIAKAFGIAKSRVALTLGETDRRKVLRLDGAPDYLSSIASQWIRT